MQRIAESELILNERGAVYHLNLLPEELAPTIITVGDPDRVREVSKYFDEVLFIRRHREFVTHTGRIGNKPLTVISTGIGPDNIDIVLQELDALVNIRLDTREIRDDLQHLQIIRVGTSGSLQADIDVDSFVASTFGLGIDNLLHFYRGQHHEEETQILQAFLAHTQLHSTGIQPYIHSAAPSLLKHFVEGFHQGITVTCPGFYGPQGRVLRLGLAYPLLIGQLSQFRFGQHRISNFEMETSALYGLSRLLGHHCVSLSAIVANRVRQTFSRDAASTMEKLIRLTLERLCQ